MQRKILSDILRKISVHEAAHGFVPKRSVLSFSQSHAGEAVVIAMDLKEYFPRITPAHIRAVFKAFGYPSSVAFHLAGICTTITPLSVFQDLPTHDRHNLEVQKLYFRPHLPQGAPTSPALANLCTWILDCRLSGLANHLGLKYTRYADDLAFSGDENFARNPKDFTQQVRKICAEEGLFIHPDKTRIMTRGGCQYLTGLVLNDHLNIRRKDYDCLKAILYNCVKHGAPSQNRDNIPHFKDHLAGKVSWVETVNFNKGHRLRQLFEKIKWEE